LSPTVAAPDLVPPVPPRSPRVWMHRNLFRTPGDSVVTVVSGTVLAYAAYRTIRFVLITGRWEIIERNLTLFMVGRFPRDELWRVEVAIIVALGLAGLAGGLVASGRSISDPEGLEPDAGDWPTRVRTAVARLWPVLAMIMVLLILAGTPGPALLAIAGLAALLAGRRVGALIPRSIRGYVIGFTFLSPFVVVAVITAGGGVGWDQWGGVLLTLFLAVGGITLCFPLGVLLALGRRSDLPAVRVVSVSYIELFRGVPLVALLLMGSLTLQLFVPPSWAPGPIIRATVVFTLFTAAYIAEIVRGGLLSVPAGQTEAAKALGMSPTRITAFIVLPQALRNVIPAIVGQFISLFKDTSLVSIISLVEILGVAQVITQQPGFAGQGLTAETLVFASVIFWVGSYTMSRESQRLEAKLGVGTR